MDALIKSRPALRRHTEDGLIKLVNDKLVYRYAQLYFRTHVSSLLESGHIETRTADLTRKLVAISINLACQDERRKI